jgi:chromosome segregation ATPase
LKYFIQYLAFKLLWAKSYQAQDAMKKKRADLDIIIERLKELEKMNTPLQKKIDACEKDLQRESGEQKAQLANFKDLNKSLKEKMTNLQKEEEVVDNKEQEIKRLSDKRKKLKKDRDQSKKNIEAKQNAIKDMEDNPPEEVNAEDIARQVHELTEKKKGFEKQSGDVLRSIQGVRKEKNDLLDKIETQRHEIQNLQVGALKKFEAIKNKYQNVADAANWIKENIDKFTGKVYGPLIAEIDAKEDQYAPAIESAMSYSARTCFVTSSHVDSETLNRYLNEKRVRGVSVFTDAEVTRSPKDISAFRSKGIKGHLIDCIDAPQPVLNTLRIHFNFDSFFLGSNAACENIENGKLLEELTEFGSCSVFAGGKQYFGKRSKYGQRALTTNIKDFSSNVQFLKFKTDKGKIENAANQLENLEADLKEAEESLNALGNDKNAIQKQADAIKTKIEQLNEQKKKVKIYESELKTARSHLTRLQKQLKEQEEQIQNGTKDEEKSIRADIAASNNKRLALLKKYIQDATNVFESSKLIESTVFDLINLKDKLKVHYFFYKSLFYLLTFSLGSKRRFPESK